MSQGQAGTSDFSPGPPRHLPKATQRAEAEAAERSRTSQPSVGAVTARGLPTARPARHRGGEGAPGRPGLRRSQGPWERAAAAPRGGAGTDMGGAGSWRGGVLLGKGAGPGRGPIYRLGPRELPAATWHPALGMKRPREPSGSDSESDGPIDVGREGELR